MTHRLADSLSGSLVESVSASVVESLYDSLVDSFSGSLVESLSNSLAYILCLLFIDAVQTSTNDAYVDSYQYTVQRTLYFV